MAGRPRLPDRLSGQFPRVGSKPGLGPRLAAAGIWYQNVQLSETFNRLCDRTIELMTVADV
jgi:hypothetical protein